MKKLFTIFLTVLALAGISSAQKNRRPRKIKPVASRSQIADNQVPDTAKILRNKTAARSASVPPPIISTAAVTTTAQPELPAAATLNDNDFSSSDSALVLNNKRRSVVIEETLVDKSTEATVVANSSTIIKILLAEHGISLIEFPADDPIYAIHPGDENIVTVDCRQKNTETGCSNSPGDAIIIRPGKMFVSWQTDVNSTATVITVQRVSGKVVSFLIFPTKQITENTFHVIVSYDLEQTVDARLRGGLAVNLNRSDAAFSKNPALITTSAANTSNVPNPSVYDSTSQTSDPVSAVFSVEEYERLTLEKMKLVAASDRKMYFSKPLFGISLAATETDRSADYVVEVVAVRNTGTKPLRLVPDQPELFVDNRDDRNKSVIQQKIPILYIATTAGDDDLLLPNRIYYFGIVYRQPILAVKQVLRLSFAGREAADQPASVILSGLAR